MGDPPPGHQLPFGMTAETIKPGAVRSMTTDKLATFSLGATKKTPFQKHKEAKEAKRKQQEEAAAAELSQWVEEFEGDDDQPKQQFVRGGVMGRPQRDDGQGGRGPPAKPPPRRAPRAGIGGL